MKSLPELAGQSVLATLDEVFKTGVPDPQHLDSVMSRWKHSLACGEPFEMEFPLRGADGAFRWFLTRVSPLRNAAGEVHRWIGTNTDIDAQRRQVSSFEQENP